MNKILKQICLVITFVGCILFYGCTNNKIAPSKTDYADIDSLSSYATSDTISEEVIVKPQTNDTVRFIDILESSSYPFSENEDDYSKYHLLNMGDDATVDSMVILSYLRKYKNLTKKEALTIINYATNNINGDADATIYGATGEVFVNDSNFFDLIVHIMNSLPDKYKEKYIRFLESALFEYGLDIIDAAVTNMTNEALEDMFNDKILPLDSIISLRNSWAEAVKDHPVKFGD